MSKLEPNDFDKFMKEGESREKPKPVEVDHIAQMKMSQRK